MSTNRIFFIFAQLSETEITLSQISESEISLPRHEPAPLQLSDCLARIPKLTALRQNKVEEKKPSFVPKLSSKTDEFFLPKDLGNFMGRLVKLAAVFLVHHFSSLVEEF